MIKKEKDLRLTKENGKAKEDSQEEEEPTLAASKEKEAKEEAII